MRTSFLDYYKLILEKVSFDKNLFKKEYQKAINSLDSQESESLNKWLKTKGLHASFLKVKSESIRSDYP